MNQLEHPAVSNALRTGWPDGKAPQEPICPVCQSPCGEIYVSTQGYIVGCDECIKTKDAWEEPECFPGED